VRLKPNVSFKSFLIPAEFQMDPRAVEATNFGNCWELS